MKSKDPDLVILATLLISVAWLKNAVFFIWVIMGLLIHRLINVLVFARFMSSWFDA
jgi:hypothetical protein